MRLSTVCPFLTPATSIMAYPAWGTQAAAPIWARLLPSFGWEVFILMKATHYTVPSSLTEGWLWLVYLFYLQCNDSCDNQCAVSSMLLVSLHISIFSKFLTMFRIRYVSKEFHPSWWCTICKVTMNNMLNNIIYNNIQSTKWICNMYLCL